MEFGMMMAIKIIKMMKMMKMMMGMRMEESRAKEPSSRHLPNGSANAFYYS